MAISVYTTLKTSISVNAVNHSKAMEML